MKSSMGTNLVITLFGKSHGEVVGAVLDGLPAGIKINEQFIKAQLKLRSGDELLATSRRENDEINFVSGVFNGYSDGGPIAVLLNNNNIKSSDYHKEILRPSSADYSAYCKYHGFQDYRGSGYFSARVTAPLVALGAIVIELLQKKGIYIASHIKKTMHCHDVDFCFDNDQLLTKISRLNSQAMPVIDQSVKEMMVQEILSAKAKQDSLAAEIESVIIDCPQGIGNPFFDNLESKLAYSLYAIPAVKAVSFGSGFDFIKMYGSEANDPFVIKDGRIKTSTNHNGGINGGISNGMPIVLSCCLKPTSSIGLPQKTVDIDKMTEINYQISGRHDSAIYSRAAVIINSMIGLTLADLLMSSYGSNYFSEDK
ncbi:MAG: chorismate synthase [Erysipelotrichaceae bacterium]